MLYVMTLLGTSYGILVWKIIINCLNKLTMRKSNFKTANSFELFIHNYSGQLGQSSSRVDKLATAGADRGQSPFAYSAILSTLGYMTLEQTPRELSVL